MKNGLVLALVGSLFMLFTTGCQQSSASEEPSSETGSAISGAWELVYVEVTNKAGEKSVRESEEPIQLKVFSDNHFAYVHLNQEGQYGGASSGAYRLDGNRYIETHRYGSNPLLEEMGVVTIAWEYTLNGDMLNMSGPLSAVDAEGNDVMAEVFGETELMVERRRRAH